MLILLLAHPHASTRTFADVVDFEIGHRLMSGIVHGGMIGLLGLIVVAHIAAARLFNGANLWVTAAVTALCGACVLMTASLVLDGFVTPALAVQFRAAQSAALRDSVESLVRFCDTSIGILMPMALLGFAVSALAWCGPLVGGGGRGRLAGILSGTIGAIVGVLILDHALMGALLLIALWQWAMARAFWRSHSP